MNQVGCGGLAVCSRNANHRKVASRPPVERRGHPSQRLARALELDIGDANISRGSLACDRGGSFSNGIRDIRMAIHAGSPQSHKQVTWSYLTAVNGDSADPRGWHQGQDHSGRHVAQEIGQDDGSGLDHVCK